MWVKANSYLWTTPLEVWNIFSLLFSLSDTCQRVKENATSCAFAGLKGTGTALWKGKGELLRGCRGHQIGHMPPSARVAEHGSPPNLTRAEHEASTHHRRWGKCNVAYGRLQLIDRGSILKDVLRLQGFNLDIELPVWFFFLFGFTWRIKVLSFGR